MTFKCRIMALPFVMALALPAMAAARVLNQGSIACQPCTECSDDSGPRIVHVRMFNQTRLRESVFANILEVTNRIWTPYGVSIETGTSADAITVVLSGGTMRGSSDGGPIAVGDTLFTAGHATPYIHLWLGGAELLARDSPSDGQSFTSKAPVARDAILLRMLGVALAHELGHYLLDSADHSSGGLLRQTLAAREMEQPDPAHLRLTRKQLQSMCQRPDKSVPE